MRSYKSETILTYHFLDTIVQSVLLWFGYDSDNVYVNLWCFGNDVNILIKALSIILHYYITSDSMFYHCISSIVVLMKDSWWWNSSNYIGRKLLSKSWYQGPCCLTVQCKFFLLSVFDQYVALNLDLASLFAARSAVEFGSKDSKTWVAWQKTWLWALIIDFKTGFL